MHACVCVCQCPPNYILIDLNWQYIYYAYFYETLSSFSNDEVDFDSYFGESLGRAPGPKPSS